MILRLLPIIASFLTSPAWAKLDFEDHAFPEFVTSARALAMGNAYICKVDDSWSSFYNPSGLGTVRGPQFHLFNVHMETSNGLMRVLGPGPAYEIPGNYMKSFNPVELRTMLAKDQGQLAHSRFNLFPNLTARGLTLGYLVSQRNRAIINDDADNNYEVIERRDHGPVGSLSVSLFGGVVKLGASAVYLNRRDLEKTFAPTETADIGASDYKTGRSLQITGGTKLTLPITFIPTFSAVLRNATASDWDAPGEYGAPEKIKQSLDLGFSITPQVDKISRLHFEVNLRDVNNAHETSAKKRVGAGAELDFRRRLFIRAGLGDGWGSGGIGIKSQRLNMDITTYAVDRSKDGFRAQEDRRWVFSFSSGF